METAIMSGIWRILDIFSPNAFENRNLRAAIAAYTGSDQREFVLAGNRLARAGA